MPVFVLPTVAHAPRICLIGQTGTVARALRARLLALGYDIQTIGGAEAAGLELATHRTVREADIVVLSVLDFASPALVAKLPPLARVLDISPAFRTDPAWVYGASLLEDDARRVAAAARVANPGCFSTAAILLLRPLRQVGLLPETAPVYLDGVGGLSTGGEAMLAKARSVEPDVPVFCLEREHRHIAEISLHSRVNGPVWFSPKIGTHERGILMQVPLAGISRESALTVFQDYYAGSQVVVSGDTPNRIGATHWAGRQGACLRVFDRPGGCVAVCTLDNLEEGSVSSAVRNINLMLNTPA